MEFKQKFTDNLQKTYAIKRYDCDVLYELFMECLADTIAKNKGAHLDYIGKIKLKNRNRWKGMSFITSNTLKKKIMDYAKTGSTIPLYCTCQYLKNQEEKDE